MTRTACPLPVIPGLSAGTRGVSASAPLPHPHPTARLKKGVCVQPAHMAAKRKMQESAEFAKCVQREANVDLTYVNVF